MYERWAGSGWAVLSDDVGEDDGGDAGGETRERPTLTTTDFSAVYGGQAKAAGEREGGRGRGGGGGRKI